MKRLLLPLIAALVIPTTANARVDPDVHKMCLQAKDYLGCVQAQSGQQRITIDQGLSLSEGNACPVGMAYVGGGNCRNVFCKFAGRLIRSIDDHPQLLEKNWSCRGKRALTYGEATARAFNDPNCPASEPEYGWQNTCKQTGGEEFLKKDVLGGAD